MKTPSLFAAAAATLLLAGTAVAGGPRSSHAYAYGGDGDELRVVVAGQGEGNVLLLHGGDGDSHSMRMTTRDGRMIIETERDADRPWLGVLMSPTGKGVKVDSVMDDSPAARAGLQAGDLIVRADDRELGDDCTAGSLLEGKKPGDALRMRVLREGSERTLRARLDSHPGRVEFELDDDMGPFGIAGNPLEGFESLRKLEALKGLSALPLFDCGDGKEPCWPTFFNFAHLGKPRLGLVLEDLSPQLARFFEVDEGRGMLVTEVREGGVAERAGLQAGDVLVGLDQVGVSSLSDVHRALKEVDEGEAVLLDVVRRGVRRSFTVEIDTPPDDADGASFSFSPNMKFRLDGTRGALEWLKQQGREHGTAALDDLRGALQEAGEAVSAGRGDSRRDSDAAHLRALEEALIGARPAAALSEAERTF